MLTKYIFDVAAQHLECSRIYLWGKKEPVSMEFEQPKESIKCNKGRGVGAEEWLN